MTKSKLSMGQVLLNIGMVALMLVLFFPVVWILLWCAPLRQRKVKSLSALLPLA